MQRNKWKVNFINFSLMHTFSSAASKLNRAGIQMLTQTGLACSYDTADKCAGKNS